MDDAPRPGVGWALRALGESTRWVVASAVGFALVMRRDPPTVCWIAASIANAVAGKILKRVINKGRPERNNQVSDPGMPSSHALSLCFLGTSVSAAQWRVGGEPAWSRGGDVGS